MVLIASLQQKQLWTSDTTVFIITVQQKPQRVASGSRSHASHVRSEASRRTKENSTSPLYEAQRAKTNAV